MHVAQPNPIKPTIELETDNPALTQDRVSEKFEIISEEAEAGLTAWDKKILALAKRETDPANASKFEPIVRGRCFAVIAIVFLGILAATFLLWNRIKTYVSQC